MPNNRTAKTVWLVQEIASLYCNADLKTRQKDNNSAISQCRNMQNPRQYQVSHYVIDILLIYWIQIHIYPNPTQLQTLFFKVKLWNVLDWPNQSHDLGYVSSSEDQTASKRLRNKKWSWQRYKSHRDSKGNYVTE